MTPVSLTPVSSALAGWGVFRWEELQGKLRWRAFQCGAVSCWASTCTSSSTWRSASPQRSASSRRPTDRTATSGLLPFWIVSFWIALLWIACAAVATPATGQTVCGGKTGAAALECIESEHSPDRTLGYDRARDTLYRAIDSGASGRLEGIYSGYAITLTPGEDPSKDAFSKDINAEHVFPQSKGASQEPETSDMHNLYPARSQVNSARSNISFGESPDAQTDTWYRKDQTRESVPSSNIDAYSERLGTDTWEPREAREGDIARAVFYFYAIYREEADAAFFEDMEDRLLEWHRNDPVTQSEKNRSTAIAARQGNENPFVLDETLAGRAFGNAASGPTLVFDPTTISAGEGEGSVDLTVKYLNPGTVSADVDVVFQAGESSASSSDIDGYETQTVSFPTAASDGATRTVSVSLTDDSEAEGSEEALFSLQNVSSSGNNQSEGAEIGTDGTAILTIVDDENPLVVNEVLADPPSGTDGDANRDGTRSATEDEFVEIYNPSSSTVDLSGYEYVDEGVGTRHVFPDGTEVGPSEAIVIFGGGEPSGTIPGVVQTASTGTLALNNGGDRFSVVSSEGTEVLSFSYDGSTEGESLTRDPDFTGEFVPHSRVSGGRLFSPGRTATGDPLPVELARFDAALSGAGPENQSVVLSWKTLSERKNAAFEVQRREADRRQKADRHRKADRRWKTVARREGAGTTSMPQTYRCVDEELPREGRSFQYRLRQIDVGGGSVFSRIVSVELGLPQNLSLDPPAPNPASRRVRVRFSVPASARTGARLRLYDGLGRKVKTLARGIEPGRQAEAFDISGLSSGLYVLRLAAGGRATTRRVTVVR